MPATVLSGGHEHGKNGGRGFSCRWRTSEQVIVLAQTNDALIALDVIVERSDASILQKRIQGLPVVQAILTVLGEGVSPGVQRARARIMAL